MILMIADRLEYQGKFPAYESFPSFRIAGSHQNIGEIRLKIYRQADSANTSQRIESYTSTRPGGFEKAWIILDRVLDDNAVLCEVICARSALRASASADTFCSGIAGSGDKSALRGVLRRNMRKAKEPSVCLANPKQFEYPALAILGCRSGPKKGILKSVENLRGKIVLRQPR